MNDVIEDRLRALLKSRADSLKSDVDPVPLVGSRLQMRIRRKCVGGAIALALSAALTVIFIKAAPTAWPNKFGSHKLLAAPTQSPSGRDFDVYRGHHWYLKLAGPSSGYVYLDSGSQLVLWDTQQQLIGSYTIEATGRLVIHWTGVSSGKLAFDQAVVDALDGFGNDATWIRSTSPTTLVVEVAGRTLTFTQN